MLSSIVKSLHSWSHAQIKEDDCVMQSTADVNLCRVFIDMHYGQSYIDNDLKLYLEKECLDIYSGNDADDRL